MVFALRERLNELTADLNLPKRIAIEGSRAKPGSPCRPAASRGGRQCRGLRAFPCPAALAGTARRSPATARETTVNAL